MTIITYHIELSCISHQSLVSQLSDDVYRFNVASTFDLLSPPEHPLSCNVAASEGSIQTVNQRLWRSPASLISASAFLHGARCQTLRARRWKTYFERSRSKAGGECQDFPNQMTDPFQARYAWNGRLWLIWNTIRLLFCLDFGAAGAALLGGEGKSLVHSTRSPLKICRETPWSARAGTPDTKQQQQGRALRDRCAVEWETDSVNLSHLCNPSHRHALSSKLVCPFPFLSLISGLHSWPYLMSRWRWAYLDASLHSHDCNHRWFTSSFCRKTDREVISNIAHWGALASWCCTETAEQSQTVTADRKYADHFWPLRFCSSRCMIITQNAHTHTVLHVTKNNRGQKTKKLRLIPPWSSKPKIASGL